METIQWIDLAIMVIGVFLGAAIPTPTDSGVFGRFKNIALIAKAIVEKNRK